VAICATLAASTIVAWPLSRWKQTTGPIRKASARRGREHRSGQAHFDLLAKFIADDRASRSESDVLRAVSDPESVLRVPSQEHPLLNQTAPLFELLDHKKCAWSMSDKLQHGPVVVVFYLNYGCDACVGSLFEMNADLALFRTLGAEVVAISDDPPELTQRRFQRFGSFSFSVLSDPGHEVARAYSIYHPAEAGQPERLLHGIFVISEEGRVTWVQTGDAPFGRNGATLCELTRLGRERSRSPEDGPAPTREEIP
jgi:peroxiredoxin